MNASAQFVVGGCGTAALMRRRSLEDAHTSQQPVRRSRQSESATPAQARQKLEELRVRGTSPARR